MESNLIWEVSAAEFLLVTCILAGGAAWMTGRAIANSWGSNAALVFYMVLLAAATRFIHFSLFGGSLLTPYYFLVDLIVIVAIAFAGKAFTRARQMRSQYAFRGAK